MKSSERAHRLAGEVPALNDVVVHHVPSRRSSRLVPARLTYSTIALKTTALAICPLRARVSNVVAAQEFPHLDFQQPLNLVDEIRALVVEDLRILEGLDLLVLGVAEGRVHHRQQPHHRRGGHLGGNQVDALSLPPLRVVDGVLQQLVDPADVVAAGRRRCRLLAIEDRPGERRRLAAQQSLDDNRIDLISAHLDRQAGLILNLAVDHRQADRAEGLLGRQRDW